MSPDFFRFTLGTFECLAVLDGTLQYPAALFFANLRSEDYATRVAQPEVPAGLMEVPYNCLYVDTGRQKVLIDTGAAGFGPTTGKLLDRLQTAGVRAEAVDTVVLTHGHPDHIGGNASEKGAPAFPRARFVMQRDEWDYWQSNPTLDESGVVAPGVFARKAAGHSPGHLVVEIESAGERLLFAADALLHPLHLEFPRARAVVDHRPEEMVSTRRGLVAAAAVNGTLVMSSHFPFPGLGYFRAKGSGWEWEPGR